MNEEVQRIDDQLAEISMMRKMLTRLQWDSVDRAICDAIKLQAISDEAMASGNDHDARIIADIAESRRANAKSLARDIEFKNVPR